MLYALCSLHDAKVLQNLVAPLATNVCITCMAYVFETPLVNNELTLLIKSFKLWYTQRVNNMDVSGFACEYPSVGSFV